MEQVKFRPITLGNSNNLTLPYLIREVWVVGGIWLQFNHLEMLPEEQPPKKSQYQGTRPTTGSCREQLKEVMTHNSAVHPSHADSLVHSSFPASLQQSTQCLGCYKRANQTTQPVPVFQHETRPASVSLWGCRKEDRYSQSKEPRKPLVVDSGFSPQPTLNHF